jgi:hypothetical protein
MGQFVGDILSIEKALVYATRSSVHHRSTSILQQWLVHVLYWLR